MIMSYAVRVHTTKEMDFAERPALRVMHDGLLLSTRASFAHINTSQQSSGFVHEIWAGNKYRACLGNKYRACLI